LVGEAGFTTTSIAARSMARIVDPTVFGTNSSVEGGVGLLSRHSVRSGQAEPDSCGCGRGSGRNVELGQDARQVIGHGAITNMQRRRDLPIGAPLSD
jgi:hypothetical protein